MLDVLVIAALIILVVVCVSLQLDLGPNDEKWERRWAWFAYSSMGLFLLWVVVFYGFVR